MNDQLDKQLCEKYPKIFRDRNAPMTETCMCWGIAVGNGWYNIIDGLCRAMTYSYTTSQEVDEEDGKRLGIEPSTYGGGSARYFFGVKPPQAIADQVKEKFGTLRFYFHLEFDSNIIYLMSTGKYPKLKETLDRYQNYFDGIVHMAEALSEMTCEDTGRTGEMHVSGGGPFGWYRVLNKEHAQTDPSMKDRNYVPVATLKEGKE
jgi:hypothetical protein